MPKPPVNKFRAAPNTTLLDAFRNESTADYQRRIPEATKAGLKETVAELWKYKAHRNEFLDAFVNKVGLTIAHANSWENPFSVFKRGMLTFGDTVEEYNVGLLQAYTYDADRDALEGEVFGQSIPDVQTSYHSINREDKYKVTVNEQILKRAFLDENGLSSLAAQLMAAPSKSDNWDEFLIMTRLLREAYDNGGFFKVNVNAVTDEASAKALLVQMRAYANIITYPSTHYNASKMPVSADPGKMVFITNPHTQAKIDVEALAAAFNLSHAEVHQRVITIPAEHFQIPGGQVLLTTEDFFVVLDTLFETTSVMNPAGLYHNYWLHHHGVYSVSRFVPAILFTTEAGDVIVNPDDTVTGVSAITLADENGDTVTDLTRGGYHQIFATATSTTAGADGVSLSISGHTSQFTRLTTAGGLLVGLDETSTEIVVTATSVVDGDFTASRSFDVVGDQIVFMPPEVATVVTPTAPTQDGSTKKVTIVATTGVEYRNAVTDAVLTGSNNDAPLSVVARAKTGYRLSETVTTAWSFSA